MARQVELDVEIGGRVFSVGCQAGEEPFLKAAAAMLNTEATVVTGQMGRIPEARMLLMAGLMLADRTAGVEEQLRSTEARLAALREEADGLRAQIEEMRNAPPPEPQRVEVPVIPADLSDALAEMTARAEALADAIEEKARA